MNRTVKGIIIVIVLILIVWAISALVGNNGEQSSDEPIKIGFIGPLTGDAAAYGEAARNGVAIAVDEINSAGGINGQQVEVIYEDGKCSGKDAASAAQKLVSIDQVKVIVGGTCSGETFGAAPVTLPAKVILFSSVSSAPKVGDLGRYVFRNHPNDNLAGDQLARYISSHYKKVAIISEQTDYAQGLRTAFTEALKAGTATLVFDESYVSSTKDFRSMISKLKDSGAEALFIDAQVGSNAAQIAKQARDLGVGAQLFTAYLTGPEFVKANPAVEGTIIIDVPGLSSGAKGEALLDAYSAKYKSEPNYKFFVGTSYDATHIVADAIEAEGLDTDKIADYLHSLKDYTGSIGTYSLDSEKAEVIGLGLVFRQVKNGEAIDFLQ